MITVSLPKIPDGKFLEDFVAAHFQIAGSYVERSILQREAEEVLELDILTTDYNLTPPDITLTEVKSGKWGFPDLFKVCGWLKYLDLNKAIFVATKSKDNLDFICNKVSPLGINLIIIPDLMDAATFLAPITNTPEPKPLDVATWRFSFWLDRVLTTKLTHKKKSAHRENRYGVMADYLYSVNSETLFQQTISERMKMLCSKYKSYPNLSARVAAEMLGASFEEDHTEIDPDLFKKTFYRCKYNDLQLSSYIEHRARIALLKHATDYVLYDKIGLVNTAKDVRKFKILDYEYELSSFDDLPLSFKEGIDKISNDPYFHRYPVFWQWFTWFYGGFILLDKETDELEHMSEHTGIPTDQIPRALQVYDILFPTGSSWFVDRSPNSRIKNLKVFPIPFMGLGAYYRGKIYGEETDLSEIPVTGMHTIKDLISWNNATVAILAKEL